MGIFHKAEQVEKSIQSAIDKLFGKGASRQPLEVRRAILDEIEGKIEPIGPSALTFPFNRIDIELFAPDAERRAIYEVAFIQDRRLENDIRQRLRQPGCELPANLDIDIAITDQPALRSDEKAFHITYQRRPPTGTSEPRRRPKLPYAQLIIMRGQATQKTYTITKSRTNIGRLPEVVDKYQRVVRRNDLVFLETDDEANQTVGREHAHIQFNEQTGEFRLCDDHSANGTRIFRDGRSIEVPSGNRRGVKLQSGDEIYFGQACVRFEIRS